MVFTILAHEGYGDGTTAYYAAGTTTQGYQDELLYPAGTGIETRFWSLYCMKQRNALACGVHLLSTGQAELELLCLRYWHNKGIKNLRYWHRWLLCGLR